jgi:hypothetical protein
MHLTHLTELWMCLSHLSQVIKVIDNTNRKSSPKYQKDWGGSPAFWWHGWSSATLWAWVLSMQCSWSNWWHDLEDWQVTCNNVVVIQSSNLDHPQLANHHWVALSMTQWLQKTWSDYDSAFWFLMMMIQVQMMIVILTIDYFWFEFELNSMDHVMLWIRSDESECESAMEKPNQLRLRLGYAKTVG